MSSVTELRDEVDVKEIKVLEDEIKLLDRKNQQYDGAFRNQFKNIKQTINKILNKDLTLNKKKSNFIS